MSFKYDKNNLFNEFEVAKNKDIALSKLDTLEDKENDVSFSLLQIVSCLIVLVLYQKFLQHYQVHQFLTFQLLEI